MAGCRRCHHRVLAVYALWAMAVSVEAYSDGADPSACVDMTPGHPGSPQATPSPYSLYVGATSYSPGDTIDVALTSNPGESFKGFLIKAVRTTPGANQDDAVGTFSVVTGTRTECPSSVGSGLTHTTNVLKPSVNLTWTAPSSPEGNINFKVTFVKNTPTYWVALTPAPELSGPAIPTNTSTPAPANTSSTPAPTSTSSAPASSAMFTKDSGCGLTRGCFHDCVALGCTFQLTWHAPQDDVVELGLKAVVRDTQDRWIAVGFSSDERMGDDSVVECVTVGGAVQASLSWNNGRSNTRITDVANPVQLISHSYINDAFECIVRRNASVAGSNPQIFDLQQDWRVMFGQGQALSDPLGYRKRRHSALPLISDGQVDLQRTDDLGASSISFPLVKAHGSLMSVAWLLLASVGILLARYFKPMWPDSTLGGLKIWFQFHRACMVLTLVATVTAFIVIFVEAGGYSQVTGEDYLKAHPILGIIVTILVIVNPIMALFRPGPDAPRRPIFNWAHWGVGSAAYLLGVVTVFLGSVMPKARMPRSSLYVLAAYLVWQFLVFAALEMVDFVIKKQAEKTFEVEMASMPPKPQAPPQTRVPQGSSLKHGILGFHTLVTLALTIVIVVFVARG